MLETLDAQLIAHHVAGPSRSIRDDLRSLLFEDGPLGDLLELLASLRHELRSRPLKQPYSAADKPA